MEIDVDIEIDRPKNKVWAAITDIANASDMISGIIALEVLHEPEEGLLGLKWTETRKIFGKESSETMWITECNDEEYYCTRAENHGAVYTSRLAVSETGGKTRLAMTFSATSDTAMGRLMSSVMSVFVKKSMIRMLQQDLLDIKNFVEQS